MQLTDKEYKIFKSAMERERKICEQIDKDCCREPYEGSLVSICDSIVRKVEAAQRISELIDKICEM